MGFRVEKYVEGIESAVEDLRTVTSNWCPDATLYNVSGVLVVLPVNT